MLYTSLRIILVCVVSFAASQASAGSLKDVAPTAPPLWHGFYAGVHVGRGDADWSGIHEGNDAPGFISRADDLDLDGLLAGIQAGFNFQHGSWLLGVEGDWTWLDGWSDRVVDVADGDDFITGDVDWLASLRGRLGVTSGGLLIYGTAGVAINDSTYRAIDDDSGTRGTVDFDDVGLVYGAGAEVSLGGKTTLAFEVLHYEFDERADGRSLTLDSAIGDFAKFEDVLVARVAINHRFSFGR